jgi:hypothetical protein
LNQNNLWFLQLYLNKTFNSFNTNVYKTFLIHFNIYMFELQK